MSRFGSGDRWDRDRFERAGRGPTAVEREQYEERDYYERRPGGGTQLREREVEIDDYRRTYGSPDRTEKERIFFEEKERYGAPVPYRPRREPARYYDEREVTVDRRELAPYRPRQEEEEEREVDIKIKTGGARPRPQFIRRQSSLETFNRKPMPRYGDRMREEVVVPLPPRPRSPPRFREREYEETRAAEPDYYDDVDYPPRVEREVEITRTRKPQEVIYERTEEDIIEEAPASTFKRGMTRMPMRLVNERAVIDLGHPFEKQGDTFVILRALGKEQIDEVVEISRQYNALPVETRESRTTYAIEAPPVQMMPPPMMESIPPPPIFEEEIIRRKTEIIRENPSLMSKKSHKSRKSHGGHAPRGRSASPASSSSDSVLPSESASGVTSRSKKSHKPHKSSARSKSRPRSPSRVSRRTSKQQQQRHRSRARSLSSGSTRRETLLREDRGHDTTLIIPSRKRESGRSIQAEIKALEAEKKALRYEREAELARRGGAEYVLEKDYRDGTVEIKKDRRAPDPRLLKAMLATLT